jgi:hypothetical protein
MILKGQHNYLDDEFKLIVKNPYFSSLSEQQKLVNKIKIRNVIFASHH